MLACPVPWGPCLGRRHRKQGSLERDIKLQCNPKDNFGQTRGVLELDLPCRTVRFGTLSLHVNKSLDGCCPRKNLTLDEATLYR